MARRTEIPLPRPLRHVAATRYLTPLREGGSLPGLVEAEDDGLYVLKFSGAGHGLRALTAEVIAGELGRALGLPIPELVIVDVDPVLASAEPDQEIQDLLRRSGGLNLGVDFLPGSISFDPAARPIIDAELAAEIVWFDALVMNVDRTARNVNLLVWHRAPWLIDHGSALYVHHTWREPGAHARRPFPEIRDHVLLPYASSIVAADARMQPRVDRRLLEAVVGQVPEAWLVQGEVYSDAGALREAYVTYLLDRLADPRAWVDAAESARQAAQEAA
jgi:hypothetical protein